MDMLEFSSQIPADQLAHIFKNFFEQHVVAYDILKGVEFIRINSISFNKASIMYSVKLIDDEDKTKLLSHLQGISLNMYGKDYSPDIFLNGDLLCITIDK